MITLPADHHQPTAGIAHALELPKIEHAYAKSPRTGPPACSRATTLLSNASTRSDQRARRSTLRALILLMGAEIVATYASAGQLRDDRPARKPALPGARLQSMPELMLHGGRLAISTSASHTQGMRDPYNFTLTPTNRTVSERIRGLPDAETVLRVQLRSPDARIHVSYDGVEHGTKEPLTPDVLSNGILVSVRAGGWADLTVTLEGDVPANIVIAHLRGTRAPDPQA